MKNFVLDNIIYIVFFMLFLSVFLFKRKRDEQQKIAEKVIQKVVKSGLGEPMTLHPEIDPALCAGCGACTKVCPEGQILGLINHKAVLLNPSKCVGHGECERACPVDAIKLVFGTKTRGMDIPRLSTNYETNVAGLYIAGELGGMGLIRNAVKQGVLAAQDAIKNLKSLPGSFDTDVLIVGAGPAGLSASLACVAQKIPYLCIEQNSFGGTVYNFPRQKVVMSHPMDLPIVGKKKFESNKVSKEDLLSYWNEIRNKAGVKISENEKFESLEKLDHTFVVKTSRRQIRAKKVILGLGVRGSPRKLGVPGEDKSKVTYNLLDPEQYQGKNIVIVGGGNAALEAAQMLGDKKRNNRVRLLVRGTAFDRANEDNIQRTQALITAGQIHLMYETVIQEIRDLEVTIVQKGQPQILPNDYIFIFAGAEMPHKFLMSLGVQIDKKFGEGLAG